MVGCPSAWNGPVHDLVSEDSQWRPSSACFENLPKQGDIKGQFCSGKKLSVAQCLSCQCFHLIFEELTC